MFNVFILIPGTGAYSDVRQGQEVIVFLLSIWNCIPDQCISETDISEKIEEWIFDASSLSERKNKTWILNSSLHSVPKFNSNYKLLKECGAHRMSCKTDKKARIQYEKIFMFTVLSSMKTIQLH